MNINHLKILLVALISIHLSACAPSGEEAASDDNGAINVKATSNIDIDRDFNLKSTSPVTIEINTSVSTTNTAFLSICHQKNNDIDYENCLVRTKIDTNSYTETLTVPNHVGPLSVAIWFYDVSTPSIIATISKDQIHTNHVVLEL